MPADNLPTALAAVSGQLHPGSAAAANLQGMYAAPVQQQTDRFSITFNVGRTTDTTIEGQVVRTLAVAADLAEVEATDEDVGHADDEPAGEPATLGQPVLSPDFTMLLNFKQPPVSSADLRSPRLESNGG